MAVLNADAQKIIEINKTIVDADEYTFKDHTDTEKTVTGKRLKQYMLVFRNIVDFTKVVKAEAPAAEAAPAATEKVRPSNKSADTKNAVAEKAAADASDTKEQQ